MTRMKRHEIRDLDRDLAEHAPHPDGTLLATIEPATPHEAHTMLDTIDVAEDGRSEWVWVRLPNGDLIFGCFPQGDTYELVTQTMIRGRV